MKSLGGSKQKGSARRVSKKPSSGALVPFAGSSSGALVPFAEPAGTAAVVLDSDDTTTASAAATLHDYGQVAATLVSATPSAVALTFHESENEVAPVSSAVHSAPRKRKKAPRVRATAQAAAAAPAAAAAAAAAQPEVAYAVERCWRDQVCKNCRSVIPEGSIRFVRIRSTSHRRSHHLGCSKPPELSSVEELRGFEALALPDAERVRAWFGGSESGASSTALVADPSVAPPADVVETEFARRDRLRATKRRNREGGRKQRRFEHDREAKRRCTWLGLGLGLGLGFRCVA